MSCKHGNGADCEQCDEEDALFDRGLSLGLERSQALKDAEIERLRAELGEWQKLRDPVVLHVSLLRGFPSKLARETFIHLAGDAPY